MEEAGGLSDRAWLRILGAVFTSGEDEPFKCGNIVQRQIEALQDIDGAGVFPLGKH